MGRWPYVYWLAVIDGIPQVWTVKHSAMEAGRKAKTFVYRQEGGRTCVVGNPDGTENKPWVVMASEAAHCAGPCSLPDCDICDPESED